MSNTTVAEKIDESLRDYLIGESPKKGEIEIYDDGTTAYVVLITAAKETSSPSNQDGAMGSSATRNCE